MRCGCTANAVHLADSWSAKNTWDLFGDNAVHLTVRCKPMQFTRRFFVPRKKWVRILVKSTLLLNRKALERKLYMKMECLDESYLTVYQLHRSDERIEKIYAKTTAVHKRATPPFSKLLQNGAVYRNVFNMSKMILLHTNPTVYHTHRFDKRLKSSTLYEIRETKTELMIFFWSKITLKPWGIRESVIHMDGAPDQYLSNGVSYTSIRQTVEEKSRK